MKKSNRGSILLIVLGVVALFAAVGSMYEVHEAHLKNTPKQIVNTISEVQAAKQISDALAAANAKADAAQKALEDANKAVLQTIAGNAEGVKIALNSDPNPSLQSKIASLMADNVLDISGQATSKQVQEFTQVIKDLMAANAQLVAENSNLKNVNLVTTNSLNQVTSENNQVKTNLALAQQANSALSTARDTAVKQVTIANNVAASSAKQIDIIKKSWEERLKNYILGFGVFPLIFICALLPLVAIAFPETLPVIRFITAPFLKLWHTLYDKLIAIEQKATAAEVAAHAVTKTALVAEQAAHAATKSSLVATVTAIASATSTPTSATPQAS